MLLLTMLYLKKTLDEFYRGYDFSKRLLHDPISFPRRYSAPEDAEVAGFIASCLSYGRVTLFMPVIERILEPAGRHPARFFRNFDPGKHNRLFSGISYRFNREEDILCFLYMTGSILKKWGSIRDLIYDRFSQKDEDTGEAIKGFVAEFMGLDTSRVYGSDIRPRGLLHFLPSPVKGSACKRMNLFLRWMIRRRDIDLGLWKEIPPSRLIIPLDTHITKISRCLGLTNRSDTGWKTAKEITESLKKLSPRDPLKYDFALCHQGISGLCKGRKFRDICAGCVLSDDYKGL